MPLNDDIMRKLSERGFNKSFNEALRDYFLSLDGTQDGITPEPIVENGYLSFRIGEEVTEPVKISGEEGEPGIVPTYLLGNSSPLSNRISVFCPNLVADSNGLLSLYITDTGTSQGTPWFKNLMECGIHATPFTIDGSTSNNSVPVIAIRDFNNTTGLLRIVIKRARGTLALSSSAFTEGGGLRFNLTVIGEKNES